MAENERVNPPGDIVLLKMLCDKYGLKDVLERIEKGEVAPKPGHPGCTFMCMDCYACPPDCTIKQ